ncbi:hypothetical protein I545_3890 [Mycobacterium kansasii 662]|uniref:Uncharacterized protein n=1 Tax=Mycobacterium kansasii 662 TaxID=1299326 RepID=X7ZEY2_MYCKA|nr:hypothetical protein I545_3890 [Mycobacterium kansasii 662]
MTTGQSPCRNRRAVTASAPGCVVQAETPQVQPVDSQQQA